MNLRPGFQEIVDGWLLVTDFDYVTDRIERSAAWIMANGGRDAMTEDEHLTVKLMIERQIILGTGDISQ